MGRNKRENEEIRALSGERNFILTSDSGPGPVVLMLGDLSQELLELAAAITVAYSDIDDCDSSGVRVMSKEGDRMLITKVHDKEKFRHYMI